MENRRVVITGFGIYSSIGQNEKEVLDSLRTGRSGIGIDPTRTEYGYSSILTGIVQHPDLKPYLNRKQRIYLSEEAEYAYISTLEALNKANISPENTQDNTIGILFGNDSSTKAIIEAHEDACKSKDTMMMGQSAVFKTMNSNITMNLSSIFNLQGISLSVSAACASSSHTIGLSMALIKQGWQDIIVCGGAQEVNTFSMASFDAIGAFSKRVSDPTKASRPFDKNRDGLVPSGGAATVILEEYEHAKRRNAPIYGEIIGYGFSSSGGSLATPSYDGYKKAIQNSLHNAGISAADIDYVNAHATSTILGDAAEAKVIHDLMGDVPVSSTKSMTGHECWMAGASEIIYSLLMMNNQFIAPNINFEEGDEETSVLNLITKTTEKKINTFLSNSFGFGGTNSCLIVRKI